MKLRDASRIFCSTCILIALNQRADASAVLCTSIPHPTNPNLGISVPVVEVRDHVPYIEVDGQSRAVKLDALTLRSGNEIDPHWIFASNLKAKQSSMKFVGTAGGPFNKELLFSVDLESPVKLEHVWIALGIQSEQLGGGIIVQEVGTLEPYSPITVTIRRQLSAEMGETKYFWHAFVRGREVLNSLIDRDRVEGDLRYQMSVARHKVPNASVAPYLTFPPRNWPDALGRVTMELKVGADGSVDHVTLMDALEPKFKKHLLEAVSRWWFLPKVAEDEKVPAKVTATINFSQYKDWSNDSVQLADPASSSPAAK